MAHSKDRKHLNTTDGRIMIIRERENHFFKAENVVIRAGDADDAAFG